MTTEWELRRLARTLADSYDQLRQLKWTPARQAPVRKMKPVFTSQTPEPDGDWSLNLEIELMRDTPDEHIPGGLRTMACDALNHTTARGYGDETRPGVLCAYLYRNAWEICEKFPAADDLADLLATQAAYINRALTTRFGNPGPAAPIEAQQQAWGTAADLAPVLTIILGRTITRQQVTSLGRNPKFTRRTTPTGTTYNLAEMADHLKRNA